MGHDTYETSEKTHLLDAEAASSMPSDGKFASEPTTDMGKLMAGAATPSARGRLFRAFVFGFMNIASSVGIVFVNKVVMSTYSFTFPVALTCLHMAFTGIGLRVAAGMGLFELKSAPLARVLPLAAAYVGSIVFQNLSLQFNTVGIYQLFKIAMTPAIVGVEALLFGKRPSVRVATYVGLLCVGVAMATAKNGSGGGHGSQAADSFKGLVTGGIATVSGALYVVWSSSKQKELGLDGTQLAAVCSPVALAILACVVPLYEPLTPAAGATASAAAATLFGYPYSVPSVAAILLSAVLGLAVTVTTMLWIGSSSSLTYSVLGHSKTLFVLLGGCMLFGDTYSPFNISGMVLAAVGMALYSHAKSNEH